MLASKNKDATTDHQIVCGDPAEDDGGAGGEAEEDVGGVAADEAAEEHRGQDDGDPGKHGALAANLVS